MPAYGTIPELIDRGVQLFTEYGRARSTDTLRQLAEIMVSLRESFTLSTGLPDWSGRTPGYRKAVAEIYARTNLPKEELEAAKAAVRYHVGNIVRARADEYELEEIGLDPASPRERLAVGRAALRAQRDAVASRQDVARLVTHANALLEFVDDTAIPATDRDGLVAARLALENITQRSAELLVRVKDAISHPPLRERGATPLRERGATPLRERGATPLFVSAG